MYWSCGDTDYQVADVDGRAVLFEAQPDGTGLRGQSFDLTAEELGQALRMGGFQLADAAATPGGQTPYVGDFRAINGNRQFVGLELTVEVQGSGRKTHLVGDGSTSGGVLDGATRGGFGHHISVDDRST